MAREKTKGGGETKTSKLAAPVKRDSCGIRAALFDEWDALRRGDSNAQQSQAVARLAGQIINSVRVELDYHRFVHGGASEKNDGALSTPLPLVSDD